MKWLILLTLSLQGCAYTAVSTATLATTGKSIADHTASLVTQNDCNGLSFIMRTNDYYCEVKREPGTTYNRHAF